MSKPASQFPRIHATFRLTHMIQEKEIQNRLAAFQGGELSLWDFYDWIESASLNMGRDSSADAVDLVGAINLLFADYDLRLLDEDSLRGKLIELKNPLSDVVAISVIPELIIVTDVIRVGKPQPAG
jgi:hypothetical protein